MATTTTGGQMVYRLPIADWRCFAAVTFVPFDLLDFAIKMAIKRFFLLIVAVFTDFSLFSACNQQVTLKSFVSNQGKVHLNVHQQVEKKKSDLWEKCSLSVEGGEIHFMAVTDYILMPATT